MDRTFPKPSNNLPTLGVSPPFDEKGLKGNSVPFDLGQNPDNTDLGNPTPELIDLGTGDTDLDFLMYQNNIYQ